MNRFCPLNLRMIALGFWLAILVSDLVADARAADEIGGRHQGKIVFFAWYSDSEYQAEHEIAVVDPATDLVWKVGGVPVKNGPISLANFRLSPDGKRIAWGEMKSDGRFAVVTSVWLRDLRPDAEPRKISDIAGSPIWSLDGKHLLVIEILSDGHFENSDRYVTWKMEADGSHPLRLPVPKNFYVGDWSPDGQWLVGISPAPGKPHDYEIVLMHPDGTDRRSLTEPGQRFEPRFSPDGKQVAFEDSSTDAGKSIKVVDLEGKNLRQVYREPNETQIQGIAWSPDSKQLVTTQQTWTRMNDGSVRLLNPRFCLINVADGRARFVRLPPAQVLGHPQWR